MGGLTVWCPATTYQLRDVQLGEGGGHQADGHARVPLTPVTEDGVRPLHGQAGVATVLVNTCKEESGATVLEGSDETVGKWMDGGRWCIRLGEGRFQGKVV